MTFKGKLVAGFGAALVILVCVGVLSYRRTLQEDEDGRWVAHTHLVLEKLDAVLTDLIDGETGQRGYIITGEESYLQPYRSALSYVRQDVKELRQLTVDNPNQQRSLDRLEPLIAARLAVLQDRIAIRQREGLAAGVEAVRGGPGKQIMDQIRALVTEMREEEQGLLRHRLEAADASSQRTKVVIFVGNALAFLFLFAAGLVVRREIGERRRAEEEVRMLNVDLERRVAERTSELAERAQELTRSNAELQQFAYVASHDLQEPLRMVASYTQLLAKRYRDKLDADAHDFIQYAVDGATRMQTLITDLLAYSRVGTQGKPLESTDCEAVFDRVVASLKLTIKESGAVVTRGPLPRVMADSTQLGQLFQNLLGNAVKFRAGERPRVHVSAQRDGKAWKFSVRDQGIGISPEHAERIFVIFQRLHGKEEYPGTGIGLAICKKIAERHGGRIWVESKPGSGATFYFTIPEGQPLMREERENHELQFSGSASRHPVG